MGCGVCDSTQQQNLDDQNTYLLNEPQKCAEPIQPCEQDSSL